MATAHEMRAELDQQTKTLHERISHLETSFATATQNVAGIIRQTAKLRDTGDAFVRDLKTFADGELQNVRDSVLAFCECVAAVEDHRQAQVARLEARVLHPFTEYGSTCKKAREDMKDRKAAREKEIARQRALDRVHINNPTDRTKISQAESELQKARTEALRVAKTLETRMVAFERQKIQDIKSVFSEYILTNMAMHAKSLELLTFAHQHISQLDEDAHIEDFRRIFHTKVEESNSAGGQEAASHVSQTGVLNSATEQGTGEDINEDDIEEL